MYTPARLSGKMDVSHVVFPIRTCTRTAPNPLRGPVYFFRISSDCFLSTYAKCHAPCAPGQSTTSERTLYRFPILQILPHILDLGHNWPNPQREPISLDFHLRVAIMVVNHQRER